jgi:hypothetical protein
VTVVMSLAVPMKDGVVLLDRNAGEFNVTRGGPVSTTNVTAALVPLLPAASPCVA